jgi:hypothetical protein
MNSILGRISPGQWELGATASATTPGSALGQVTCRGFAVAALVVVALGCAHASGSATGSISNVAQPGEFSSVLGHLSLGDFELGQTASVLSSRSSAGGRTGCSGFAAASLHVSALGSVHASGGCVREVNIRVTQVVAETVYEQTANANILVTQEVAEVVYEQATNAILRVTQVAVEVVTEEFQALAGQARCSGSCQATLGLTATAQGKTSARGKITTAAVALPGSARGRTSAWGQALPGIQRIALIGRAQASGSAWAALSQSATGRTSAYGQVAGSGGGSGATVLFFASAAGIVRCRGFAPAGYLLAVAATGQVQTSGGCLIGLAGSNAPCLTGGGDALPAIPNYVY